MDIVLPPSDSKRNSVARNGADNPAYHMETDETASYEHLSPKPEGENSTVERFTTEPVATATDEGPVPLAQLHVCVLNNELSSDTWSDISSTVDDGYDVGHVTGDPDTSCADEYIVGPKSAVETRFDAVPSKNTDFNLNRSGIFLPGRTSDPFVTTDGEDAPCSDSESTHIDLFVTTDGEDAPCSDSESTHSDPFLGFYQKVDLSQNVSEDYNYDTNQSGLEESKNAPRPMTILLPTEMAFLGRNNESDSSIQQITVNSMMMSSIVGRERGCDDDDDDDDGGGGGTSSPSTSGASIEAYVAGVAFDETPDVICTTQL